MSGTVALDDVRDTLKEHFPEWLSGYCSCGVEIPIYNDWLEHVMRQLEPPAVAQGDSAIAAAVHETDRWYNDGS